MTARSCVSNPLSSPSTASAISGFGRRSDIGIIRNIRQIVQPVVGEHMAHALARALAPHRDDDALAARLQRVDVLGHGIEDVGLGFGALGREVVPLPRAGIDHGRRPDRRTA